ncbi:MAG: hypothetical protein JXX28_17805, partial [Deltaproteobacteria bacterium]|nr:hypothetical protein [Deltaproteobacteria bacterium]
MPPAAPVGELVIDASWHLCADPGTLDLAHQLAGSQLLVQGDSAHLSPLNAVDGFPPGVATRSLLFPLSNPAECALASATKVIYLRDWSTMATAARYPNSTANYLAAFPELQPWSARLEHDPQSYAISYNAPKQQILIMGASPQGAQFGTVGFLRDSDHRLRYQFLQGFVPYIVWDPRSVLDYPELLMRMSSYPNMNSSAEVYTDPWRNSVIWNRYTHVG